MKRLHLLELLVCTLCCWGCGDDDSPSPSDTGTTQPPPSGSKTLEKLSEAEVEGLCGQLLTKVRGPSTPEALCVESALAETTTEAACNTVKKSCLSDKDYADLSAVKCAKFSGSGAASAPEFPCDTKVSEVTACFDKVATWFKALRCSQAGKAANEPACMAELDEGDCSFRFSALLDEDLPERDAAVNACTAGSEADCKCSDGRQGTQRCDEDGLYEPCECGAAIDGGSSAFVCKAGSQSYPYDFGGGAQCNACATQNCCDSFAACEADEPCACFWACLADPSIDDCMSFCGLGPNENPPDFVDHAQCLGDACAAPCGLN